VEQIALPDGFEVLVVPEAAPQTKPKALNYGLQFARGELVAIYDAEDVPARGQLRLAAETFAAAPSAIVCLQAGWPSTMPARTGSRASSPSNTRFSTNSCCRCWPASGCRCRSAAPRTTFRIAALRRIGAWDPHNVTEDADLGMRLARFGWRAAVIASTTGEEAACRWGVWLRQRARWLKGWMQVGLVHLRAPRRTWRELGPAGSLMALVLMVGMTLSALTHPVFMALFVWSVAAGGMFAPEPDWMAATVGGCRWPFWRPAMASTWWPAGWRSAGAIAGISAAASPGACWAFPPTGCSSGSAPAWRCGSWCAGRSTGTRPSTASAAGASETLRA
jgi:glycosyltransferase XagB